jgi:hypothetical protein
MEECMETYFEILALAPFHVVHGARYFTTIYKRLEPEWSHMGVDKRSSIEA